ncbi:hypothetical protein CEG14_09445 [Bordetella genomosp. 1]|uniref:FHA domain-containing protein n=1 Tax=Bordetella genomosp. 1 TaxID=1395607 RepID=A0A261SDT9_9BORD|nr:FHA domain-containing protein [Bordetella genomosp. 1]OZI35315.1 hypothetical protein CEG14_09445 [Bordetella genomosp. 1]
MKLTALQHQTDRRFVPFAADFDGDGGTIGSAPGNVLTLPAAPGEICRLQAALRIDGHDRCSLLNLSGMAPVRINGVAVAPWQRATVRAGDTLEIGPYALALGEPPQDSAAEPDPLFAGLDAVPGAAAVPFAAISLDLPALHDPLPGADASDAPPSLAGTVAGETVAPATVAATPVPTDAAHDDAGAMPDPLAAAEAPAAPAGDVFADLFGPGTLPVGAAPDVDAHPFALRSDMERNPADPLAHLQAAGLHAGEPGDPLAAFDSPDSPHLRHVMSDATPGVLSESEAEREGSPIRDALDEGRARGDDGAQAQRQGARDYGGAHVRMPTPRR